MDVLSGPSRALGLSIGGEGTAVVRGSVVRMRTTSPIASSGPTDYAEAISFIGAPSPANPSLAISDSAITGGKTAIDIRPHPNNSTDDYRATASVVRTSIDAGVIGVSENPGVSPFIRDVIGASLATGQALDFTLRDVVAAGAVFVDADPDATVTLTCANNFLGNQAQSVFTPTTGSCTGNNTSALGAALPDLTEANAWNTSVPPAQALATAFRPGVGSVLLDSATGTGAPAADLAGNPRLVDAGDPDCIAQADRGAYERQGLATPAASCPPPPGGGGPSPVPAPSCGRPRSQP